MGFKIFMTIVAVMVPLMMAVVGRVFMSAAPKTINPIFGYRTTMSMKNDDTWQYAHAYCGRIWFVCGLVFTVMAAGLMVFSFSKDEKTVGVLGAALCFLSVLGMVWSVVLTERGLKEAFDEDGERRVTEPTAQPFEAAEEPPVDDVDASAEVDEEEAFFADAPVSAAPPKSLVDELLDELAGEPDIFDE